MTIENTLDHGLKTSVLDSSYKAEQDQNWAALDPNRISAGTFANRPAAGTVNRFYYATDTTILYWDNGATWDVLSSAVIDEDDMASNSADRPPSQQSTKVYADLGRKNFAINGSCRVGQGSALTLGASTDSLAEAEYGIVDMFAGFTTQTASAGILTQLTSTALIGDSGYALHFDGVTLGAGGKLHAIYRIEAKDGALLQNKTISIQLKNYHDIGSAKTATIYLRDADVADDFSATSVIGNNGGSSVNDATDTTLLFEGIDLTSHNPERGLEIEVELDCDAITAKDWLLTDLQIEVSSVVTPFELAPFADELTRCQRSYEEVGGKSASDGVIGFGFYAGAAFTWSWPIPFKVEKRTAPTLAVQGTWNITNCGQPTVDRGSKTGFRFRTAVSGAGNTSILGDSVDDKITADARLR